MPARALLAGFLLALAFPVLATPQPRNATDMWFDPAESGWGLNLIHQGDTLFGTLFVYDTDGQPKWLVASALVGGPTSYSGALHECAGPWFGGSFSSVEVACNAVGTMRFDLGDSTAVVDYTVGNVRVAKQVQRFTFRPVTLSGSYEGYILEAGGQRNQEDWTFHVTENGSSFSMSASSDSEGICDYTGVSSQNGQYKTVSGSFRCNGGTRSGSWSMTVDPTTEGFSGSFVGDGFTNGRIAGARISGQLRMQGLGWRNDMWFIPSESGWGLNVIEQGDTLFATLFVYDAQRRPRWYVASSLAQQGDATDGSVTYSGPLHSNTGPYFGTAFNPSAVGGRQVGQMSFRARADGTGELAYSVDNVQVTKTVQRFAFHKQNFSGTYLGSYEHDRQAEIAIDDSGTEFRMQLVDLYGGAGTCTFVAPYMQLGSLRSMVGTFTCGSTGGTFSMRHATVSGQGFTARFDSPLFAFRVMANEHIGGARR
ncbi:MAG TPA: hypothetical protein VEC19_15245 [Usitatibacter sp.]|nr:hypothetical protein [Usitatibacter sp.]